MRIMYVLLYYYYCVRELYEYHHSTDRHNRYSAVARRDATRHEAQGASKRGFVRRLQHTKSSFSIWLWNNEQRSPRKKAKLQHECVLWLMYVTVTAPLTVTVTVTAPEWCLLALCAINGATTTAIRAQSCQINNSNENKSETKEQEKEQEEENVKQSNQSEQQANKPTNK